MAPCKKPAAKCAKKAADVKAVKPAKAETVKGGMNKAESATSTKAFLKRR